MNAPVTTTPPVTTPEGTTPPVTPPGATWTATLTDESLRSHQGLAKFKDVDSLAKSYIELDKLRNERTGVKPLTAESTPEEIAAYRTAMGIPEKADGYEVGELAFPEDATPTQEQMGAFRSLAHTLHLTPAQVQGILQWYSQDVSQQWNSLQEARAGEVRTHMDTLTKKYGAQAPQLVQMAQEYVRRRYGQAGLDAFEAGPGQTSALGNHPIVLEMLIESARLTGHDKFIMADAAGGLVNQASAQQRYDAAAKEYYTTQDEGRKAALKQEMEQLARIASP